MNIVDAGNYQDFKQVLNSLPFKPEVIFTNGQSYPTIAFRAMAIFHEWKIAVMCHGTDPTTFAADFPNAVALGQLPGFLQTQTW